MTRKDVNEKELSTRVNKFLGGLASKNKDDIKQNAQVLAEIVKGFSSSYGVELSDVMTILKLQKNGVNCADVRDKLNDM